MVYTLEEMSVSVELLSADCPVVVLDYESVMKPAEIAGIIPSIAQAFGNHDSALGIVVVRNVPEFVKLRAELLPLIRKFATSLPESVREKYENPQSSYSVGWSHGKEAMAEGKPDFSKGSYYFNPICDRPSEDPAAIKEWPEFYEPNIWPSEDLPELEKAAKSLGKLIVNVGQNLARHCDYYVSQCLPSFRSNRISSILQNSTNCKARLLHYFAQDNSDSSSGDWCGWHNDHGSLTGLVPAIYYDIDGDEVRGEQISSSGSGLYIRSRTGVITKVNIPSDVLAFQIGETAQVHSGGILEATPHFVKAAKGLTGVSRETLAVFLEPQWNEPMDMPEEVDKAIIKDIFSKQNLPEGVPTLGSRWEEGIHFGRFTKNTLSAYYK